MDLLDISVDKLKIKDANEARSISVITDSTTDGSHKEICITIIISFSKKFYCTRTNDLCYGLKF